MTSLGTGSPQGDPQVDRGGVLSSFLLGQLTGSSVTTGTFLGYLVVLAVAEVLTTIIEARVGLVVHSILLAVLLTHAAVMWDQPGHRMLLTLAFAPMIRLLSLSLPLTRFPIVYWYLITSIPLFVAAVMTVRLLRLSRRDLALTFNWSKLPAQILISTTGLGLGYLEYLILRPDALADSLTWQQILVPAIILLVSTGFFEELIFRSIMQGAAVEAMGHWRGLIYVSLVFAALHIGYKSVLDVVFVFSVGLFFAWAVAKTRSIAGVTMAHGLTNIMLFLVMPFLIA